MAKVNPCEHYMSEIFTKLAQKICSYDISEFENGPLKNRAASGAGQFSV